MATVYVGCVQFIVSVFPNEVKYSALYFTWKWCRKYAKLLKKTIKSGDSFPDLFFYLKLYFC